MGPFERRLRNLVNPVSTGITQWWCSSSARRAWRRRMERGAARTTRHPRDLGDLRHSETARKAQEALRDLRGSDTARRAQDALRDLRDSETARKTQDALRDLRDTEAARKAQATVRDFRASERGRKAEATIQEAEAAARAAYLRLRRSMGDDDR
jgi:hypothetical protein